MSSSTGLRDYKELLKNQGGTKDLQAPGWCVETEFSTNNWPNFELSISKYAMTPMTMELQNIQNQKTQVLA